MRRLRVLVFLYVAFPALGLDRSALTFTRYDLNVRIEPQQQRLAVRGKIMLRNDSDSPQKDIALQISSTLNWVSIQAQGKPVYFASHVYTSDIDHSGALSEAIVTLPNAVEPKQSIELEIGYEGVITQDAARLIRSGAPADVAKHSDWDRISPTFTAIRGIGYVAWYPVATEAVNIADGSALSSEIGRWKRRHLGTSMTVNLCMEGNNKSDPALMNTALMNDEASGVKGASMGADTGGDFWACVQHPYTSLGTTVPTIAIANFSKSETNNVFLYSLGDDQPASQNFLEALKEVRTLLVNLFGERPGLSNIVQQVIDLPEPEAEPYESGNTLLVPFKAKDSTLLLSAMQQATHERFPSPRIWIRDGLARYAQLVLLEDRSGKEVSSYLQSQSDAVRTSENEAKSDTEKSEKNSLINSPDEFFIARKAASVWWMLKTMLGQDALKTALSNYTVEDDKDPLYVEKLIEAQTHRDLKEFFDDWVYHDRGLPDFKVDSVYPRQLPSGGFMVTATVENLGQAGAEVPVTVHMGKGEETQRLAVPGKSKASVRIQTATAPVEVSVNDGSVPESDTQNNSFRLPAVPHVQ